MNLVTCTVIEDRRTARALGKIAGGARVRGEGALEVDTKLPITSKTG